jgi:hypothetical protein
MMDLFEAVIEPDEAAPAVADPQRPDEWDAIAFEPWEPQDEETEAAMTGTERAGVPGWSQSAKRIEDAWTAFLQKRPAERRAELERIEAEYYRAARRRKVALAAMDQTFPGGG